MTLINDEDLLYTKDELAFRKVVKAFIEKEIAPIAEKVEKENYFPINIIRKLGEESYTGLMVPLPHGWLFS